jgi:hypothetical protein
MLFADLTSRIKQAVQKGSEKPEAQKTPASESERPGAAEGGRPQVGVVK